MMEAAAQLRKAAPLWITILLFAFLAQASAAAETGYLGVNLQYPVSEVTLPKAEHLVDLLKIIQIRRVKLSSDVQPSLLTVLGNSGIEVLQTVHNEDVESIATSEEAAAQWLASNVLQFLPATNITGVVVGDGFFATNMSSILVPAMRNLYAALRALDVSIKISTAVPMSIFTWTASHPSSASFKDEFRGRADELLRFLSSAKSYLMINIDPIEEVEARKVDISFAILSSVSNTPAVHSGLSYTNLLDASIDATYTALEKAGFGSLPVVVGSIGWPWEALAPSNAAAVASVENAALFHENLVSRILRNHGTPKRPKSIVGAYVTELYDVVKPDDEAGIKRYGLFSATEAPRFNFDALGGRNGRILQDTGNGSSPTTPSSPSTPPVSSGGTGCSSGQYCVAKQGASDSDLSVGLNWACGQGGVDCTQIMQNGACYNPNTYFWHASYAFNSYYQQNCGTGGTCDFSGAATLTSSDPSTSTCAFVNSAGGGVSGGNGSSGNGSSGTTMGGSTNGVIQPINPSGNFATSTLDTAMGIQSLILVILLWSLRP